MAIAEIKAVTPQGDPHAEPVTDPHGKDPTVDTVHGR